jgi:alanine racemase
MISLTPEQIARITGAGMIGNGSGILNHICTDTRKADRPEESLFIALKGPNHDGHQFIMEAFRLGFKHFIVSEIPVALNEQEDSTFLVHPDPTLALQQIASHHRQQLATEIIAITGSNGKTIVKEWLAQVLSSFARTGKSPKSYNSQIGVPLSVLTLEPADRFGILEAGISKPGEMAKLEKVLVPDIGIFTNIGDAHQENFLSLADKIREKLVLFRHSKTFFYCSDQSDVAREIQMAGLPAKLVSWSREQEANLRITSETTSVHHTKIEGIFENRHLTLLVPFTDKASVDNLVFVWLVTLHLRLDQVRVQQAISALEPVKMRLEQKAGINGCTLINDFYNSDIVSIRTALDLLFQQTHQDRKTVIISDILQTGLPEPELYSSINHLLEGRKIHRLIGIGPAIIRNRGQFKIPIETWVSTDDFVDQLNPERFNDEAILLKGARQFTFESISRFLEAKIHATILEIRMEDVRNNLNHFRQALNPGTGIMVMIKAFSYGSGGLEIARFLANERVDYMGVAFADEGVEIRRSGIRTPIMVMNPDFRQSDILIENRLEPEIFNWQGLKTYARAAREEGGDSYPAHLKFDTGMHRLGFSPADAELLSKFLAEHPEIKVKSVFSHLSASEDPDSDAFTRQQISKLNQASEILKSRLGYPFLKHILNTSGIKRFPEAQFDMVRLGIGLYGYESNGNSGLRPVATLKTVISQIHDLPAGEHVGYGRLTILKEPAKIAIIPIGYADGIDRRLGNGNYRMMVKGQFVRTIGNICMDMTILDVTGSKASEGDEVLVFSPDHPVTEMAQILGTIPYEVLTSIPSRVKRIYLFD